MGYVQGTIQSLVIVAVVVVLFGFSRGYQQPHDRPSPTISPQKPVSNSRSAVPSHPAGERSSVIAGVQDYDPGAFVKRVIDGDTIVLTTGEVVRYIGIDAPEQSSKMNSKTCFSQEATSRNRELVEGKRVHLEKDITDRDRYNRLLRYVYVGSTFVNEVLVREGFAYSYSYPPDISFQNVLRSVEKQAREENLGLWGVCPSRRASARDSMIPTSSSFSRDKAISCEGDVYDCSDFNAQQEAQTAFETCGGARHDVHNLDKDGDGEVCESLP